MAVRERHSLSDQQTACTIGREVSQLTQHPEPLIVLSLLQYDNDVIIPNRPKAKAMVNHILQHPSTPAEQRQVIVGIVGDCILW